MRITVLCKRRYTNLDLVNERFGRLFHFPLQLAARGHETRVIALDYHRGTSREHQVIDNVRFLSEPAARPVDLLTLPWRLADEVRKHPADVYVASGDMFVGALAAMIHLTTGKPWVFDVYDDYRHFGLARIPGAVPLFNLLIARAPATIAVSQALATRLEATARHVEIVGNGIDPARFHKTDRRQARREVGISESEIVIGYFGGISRQRGTEVLLQAFDRLRKESQATRLLLAGKNLDGLDLQGPGVDYRGIVAHSAVPALIAASDVVTIPYLSDPLTEATHACKLAEYLACGVPIAATRVADIPAVLGDTPEALAEPGSADSLVQALQFQLRHRQTLPFPSDLTWAELSGRVERLLVQVVAAGQSHGGTQRR